MHYVKHHRHSIEMSIGNSSPTKFYFSEAQILWFIHDKCIVFYSGY